MLSIAVNLLLILSISLAEITLNVGYPINELNPKGDPLPFQTAFHRSLAKYRLNAGGFGTGGTTTLCLEAIKQSFKYPKNYGLLGRKDLTELKSTTLKELFDLCPPQLIKDHNKQEKTITFINDSQLFYLNLDDSREAVEKIKSLNLGFACVDQLEEIEEAVFLAIKGRLRRNNSSKNFFAKCNPEGHNWMWHKWKEEPYYDYLNNQRIPVNTAIQVIALIEELASKRILINKSAEIVAQKFKNLSVDQIKTLYDKSQYELFEATTLENVYLPPEYVNELLSYPEKWVKRYVYCSWDDFEGIVYSEFVEARHKIDPYQPADNEQFYIILDYGFRNPTAILYAATDYDGVTRIYDEYYESGKLISDISKDVRRYRNWQHTTRLIDPSAYNVQRDGKSVADEFAIENGISFIPADNSVAQGINRVNELFKDDKLFVCSNCVNFLREIGNYKWKEIKPGQPRNEYEEPVKKNDHLMDDVRYLANWIYTPVELKPQPEPKDRQYHFDNVSQTSGLADF